MRARAVLALGLVAAGSQAPQATELRGGDSPLLVGRFVDEDQRPIGSVKAGVAYWSFEAVAKQWTSIRCRDVQLASDLEGRFSIPLARTSSGETAHRRSTTLRQDVEVPLSLRAVQFSCEGLESFEIEIPQVLPAGPWDLGDVHLVRPGSIRWLAAKDDAALEAEYRRAVTAREHYAHHARAVETCLTEIVRRASPKWEAFLSAELARERAQADPRDIQDLALLTALRRVQGKPDPLAIQLAGSPELECALAEAPTISLRLRNVDTQGETFCFTFGPRYEDTPFYAHHLPVDAPSRFALQILDASGSAVATQPMTPIDGSIQHDRAAFEPGVELEFELPLRPYATWPCAGEYLVRILYHDEDPIAEAADCTGWITSSSTWLTVHVIGKPSR